MFVAFIRQAAVAIAVLVAAQSTCVAAQDQPWLDEFRIGDTVGQAYDEFVHLEALFSPISPGPTYVPSWLLSPRPFLGATISVQGKTDELFAGWTWSAPVPGPFLLEGSFGGTVHDQPLFVSYPDRPELTTRFLFRESIAVGYQIDPQWRVLVSAEHESDGDLGYLNHSVDRAGIELGRKFGNPVDEPPPAPAPSPFSWGGPYFGASGGLVEASTANIAVTEPGAAATAVGQRGFQNKSLIVGGQIGYNFPIGDFVTGVEADLSALSLHTGILSNNENLLGPYIVNATMDWLATARLRAGVNIVQFPFVNGVLIYGTGGAAFASISSTYCLWVPSCLNNGLAADGWSTQSPQLESGWTAGGGIEAPLAPNITGKLEYLYVDLDAASFHQGTGTYAPKFTEQFLRGGLNILFPVN
jgi:outer membrane immunogenic protein